MTEIIGWAFEIVEREGIGHALGDEQFMVILWGALFEKIEDGERVTGFEQALRIAVYLNAVDDILCRVVVRGIEFVIDAKGRGSFEAQGLERWNEFDFRDCGDCLPSVLIDIEMVGARRFFDFMSFLDGWAIPVNALKEALAFECVFVRMQDIVYEEHRAQDKANDCDDSVQAAFGKDARE